MYAAVAYTLFWLLDKNSSLQAREALTNWLRGPNYNKENVASLILYAFDKIYTPRLLSLKAFAISAALSTAATAIVSFHLYPIVWYVTAYVPEMRSETFSQLAANIVADYLSLFFIRRWLVLAGQRPLMALITAPIIGVVIVIVVYLVRDVGGFSIQTWTFHLSYFIDDFNEWSRFLSNHGVRRALLLPAFVVHLWLPLFALGVVLAKIVNSLRAAGRFSQWLFLQGEAHPFRSVGAIAAVLTFTIVAIGIWIVGIEKAGPTPQAPDKKQHIIIIEPPGGFRR